MKLKKILCAVLALAMLAGCASSFVGCGKKQVAEKQVVDHVYRATYLERPKDLNYVQRMFVQDDYVYMYGEHYDQETYESEMRLFRMGLDGSNVTRLDMPGVQIGEDSYLQEMLMVPDGSVWQIVHTSHYNEETYEYFEEYHIYHVAADGTVLADVNPKDIWDRQAEDPENGAESGIYHYIHSCMLLEGNFVFQDSDKTLYRLSGDGQLVGAVDVTPLMESGYINRMLQVDGKLTLMHNDYSGPQSKMALVEVDWDASKLLAPVELDANIFQNVWNFFDGEGYTFYYSTQDAVYGYDAATQTSTELLNFMNSDMSANNVNDMVVLSQDQFIARGWDDLTGEDCIMILNRVPDDQIVPKYILTLAVVGDDWSLRNSVLRFNRQSEEYRVQIKKYSIEEYYEEGTEYHYQELVEKAVTALNNDIIAGHIPDILHVNQYMPLDNYISKGMLADLYTFIDNDPNMKREDFLTNVLEALEVGGKLYEIMPSFNVRTLVGKDSMLGGRKQWTMGEFIQWSKGIPEGSRVFFDMTRDQLLELFCTFAYEEFVDPETGTCYFDTEDFKQVLQYVNTLSNTSVWEEQDGYDEQFYQDYSNRFRADLAMLEEMYLSSFDSYPSWMSYTFYTEDITMIGLPSMNGNGSAITMDSMNFAISAKSPVIDGAWDFVSYFLSPEYQDSLEYTFPLRVSSLEKLADKVVAQQAEEKKNWEEYLQNYGGNDYIIDDDMVVMPTAETEVVIETEEPAETDEDVAVDTDIIVEEPVIGGGIIGMPNPFPQEEFRVFLTEEMADEIIEFIKSLNHVYRYNVPVNNIIKEEAAQYFAGQKSLDDTVRIIQNRVFTYVAERR